MKDETHQVLPVPAAPSTMSLKPLATPTRTASARKSWESSKATLRAVSHCRRGSGPSLSLNSVHVRLKLGHCSGSTRGFTADCTPLGSRLYGSSLTCHMGSFEMGYRRSLVTSSR